MIIKYNSHLLLTIKVPFFAYYLTSDDIPFIFKNKNISLKLNKYEPLIIDYKQKSIYFCHIHIYELNYNRRYDYFIDYVSQMISSCMSER